MLYPFVYACSLLTQVATMPPSSTRTYKIVERQAVLDMIAKKGLVRLQTPGDGKFCLLFLSPVSCSCLLLMSTLDFPFCYNMVTTSTFY